MADLRIVDAPVLLQESITDDVKMPTGGLGNFSIRLGDIVWYVVAKENLASKGYVDLSSKGVKDSLDEHIADNNNPHNVTKVQVGLGNVDNTADIDKPVSNATKSAIITATTDMATKTYVNSKDGDLTTLTTTNKTNLVKAINEVVSVKADKATTLTGYGINDAYTKSEIDTDFSGIKTLYDKNVAAGAGANGWTDVLIAVSENVNQRQINDGLDTIAQLLAIRNPRSGQRVYVKSYLTPNYGLLNPYKGGGLFAYDSNKVTQNDGIGVINGWVRIDLPDMISPFMAGAKGDYTTDDYDAINKALIYSRLVKKPVLIDGLFATSKPIVLLPHDTMLGLSQTQSRIKKLGNDVLDLAPRKPPERSDVNDVYNVDAVVIFYPYDNTYAAYITLENVFFEKGSYNDGSPSVYGLYAPRHCKCVTKNLEFDNVNIGFFAKVLFLNQHINFTSVSGSNNGVHQGKIGMLVYDGEDKMTGTSNLFERFLFVNYERAYEIQNLQTSRFAHCYGEAISRNGGADDTQVFFINNPYNLHFDCCGMEGIKGTPLYIASTNTGNPSRSVTFTGFQARWGVGGTTTDKGINAVAVTGNDLRVTFDNSTVIFNDGGFYNNLLFVTGNAVVTKSASVIGDKAANLATTDARLIDFDKNVLTPQNTNILVTSNKRITNDLNDGIGWESGVMHKVVDGAAVNIPSGIDAVYGVSVWYGLNATQGVQMLYLVNNPNVYKRIVTGAGNTGTWAVV